jgi:Rrf2 family transcriptional regulator, iron-sulfur cluster assembly transcription factor
MRLTTKGRYAVTAMIDLAFHGHDKAVTLNEIAARQAISLSYLEQLFARLRKAGMVQGVRGPGGGYQLRRKADCINIAEIINAVDEQIDATRCGGKSNCHGDSACLTHDLWSGLSDQISLYLKEISLAELVNSRHVKEVALRQHQGSKNIIKFDPAPIKADIQA